MKGLLVAFFLILFFAASSQDVLDYRYAQSAVRNQKARGTCTAFSICAALETFPGIPSNLSEQYLFAQAKFKRLLKKDVENMDDGEFLEFYLNILETDGVLPESKMPYDTNAVTFTNDKDVFTQFNEVTKDTRFYDLLSLHNITYKINRDEYTSYIGEEARQIETIKYWLRKGVKAIPVSYPINSAAWSTLSGKLPVMAPDSVFAVVLNGDTLTYNAAKRRDSDINQKILHQEAGLIPLWNNGLFNRGHAVTIVGYNKDGFIIKNSWGVNWADRGYAVISYDYHQLFCKKALIFNNFQVNALFAGEPDESYNAKDLCLKTLPVLLPGNEKALALSYLYDGDKTFPVLKNILLKFYLVENAGQSKTLLTKSTVLITKDGYRNGYNTIKKLPVDWAALQGKQVRAEITFTLANGTVFINTYPLIEWKNRTLHPGLLDALKFDDDD